jgi:hypothetical protein
MILKKENIYQFITDLLIYTNNTEKNYLNETDFKNEINDLLSTYSININFYCINFKNEDRKNRIKERFNRMNLENNLIFTNPVFLTDERLNHIENVETKRNTAILYQHLDSLVHFIEKTNFEYCIVCEDDILIDSNFRKKLPMFINNFEKLKLDVMLLGYLLPYELDMSTCLHKQYFKMLETNDEFSLHEYPDDLWGSQMYLVNRKYAQFLINKYLIDKYDEKPLNPDWTITKDSNNRALVYPVIALEEGVNISDNQEQVEYHKLVYDTHFREGKYL